MTDGSLPLVSLCRLAFRLDRRTFRSCSAASRKQHAALAGHSGLLWRRGHPGPAALQGLHQFRVHSGSHCRRTRHPPSRFTISAAAPTATTASSSKRTVPSPEAMSVRSRQATRRRRASGRQGAPRSRAAKPGRCAKTGPGTSPRSGFAPSAVDRRGGRSLPVGIMTIAVPDPQRNVRCNLAQRPVAHGISRVQPGTPRTVAASM